MQETLMRHMWGPGLFELLFLGLIIGGAVVLILLLARGRPPMPGQPAVSPPPVSPPPVSPPKDIAIETVRMRYAKGEISQEEFKAMSADLAGVE